MTKRFSIFIKIFYFLFVINIKRHKEINKKINLNIAKCSQKINGQNVTNYNLDSK